VKEKIINTTDTKYTMGSEYTLFIAFLFVNLVVLVFRLFPTKNVKP